MPSLDTNQVSQAAGLPMSIFQYIQQLLRRGPNFQPAQSAYGAMRHPSLSLSPGGEFLDPMQLQQSAAPTYLGERGGIASQDINDRMGLIEQMRQAGSNYASLINSIPMLQAANIGGGGGSGGGLFGGLF